MWTNSAALGKHFWGCGEPHTLKTKKNAVSKYQFLKTGIYLSPLALKSFVRYQCTPQWDYFSNTHTHTAHTCPSHFMWCSARCLSCKEAKMPWSKSHRHTWLQEPREPPGQEGEEDPGKLCGASMCPYSGSELSRRGTGIVGYFQGYFPTFPGSATGTVKDMMCQHPLCGQATPDQTTAGHSLLHCTHGKYRATSLDFGKGWNSFNWRKPEHSRPTNSGFVWKKKNDPSLYTRWFMCVWKSVLYTQWFMCTWKSIRFSFCSCLISIPNPTHWSHN